MADKTAMDYISGIGDSRRVGPTSTEGENKKKGKTMKNTVALLTTLLAFTFAGTAYGDAVVQHWTCTLKDDKAPAELIEASSRWLEAARRNENGDDIRAFVEYPIAVDSVDNFTFVVVFPDTKAWGAFNHNYPETPAGQADEAWSEVATCSSSSIWGQVEIE